MGMKTLYKLKDMLCQALDEIAGKGDLGAGDLDIAHKLTDTVKNIYKIEALSGQQYSRDGYSRGEWAASRGSYGRENSYRRSHYVRGHYSNDDGGKEDMKRQLQEMLDQADDDSIRNAIQRCMNSVEW